ncbi:thioredoxin domain-containing protein [Curtobacterium sp. MCBD17_034]|uniref:thioredoxin domain-containing protein n=1 Tax=unclassified Curtobacterium TaxID=257496 RepID=UPI000DA7CC34|nr:MULTISPECIES: DUF255 domain-containing protein [unclassified Curtobacterium]PZF56638.1 thioredoxin domain-containing protein [Curtobacterium sp. MCBD17_034]PZM33329.1 thioredoxin domain-containing protein [Curtobacterium sp. MCBD17_031]
MSDNRLGTAVSPYLRAHADNPVDWREWGTEAFAEAAERDVPVFVSIGYATCHWCHVMARESFSDPAIADELRRDFVSVKVDREERPDVDSSAMIGASAFTQNLGWPLSVFMTPGGRVFYAGTYFPPEPVQGHPSFRQVLGAVREAWTDRRDEVDQNADGIAAAITAQSQAGGGADDAGSEARGGLATTLPDPSAVHAVVDRLAEAEDREFGGFGSAPKFPNAPLLEFLVDAGADGDGQALDLAERTLTAIAGSDLLDPLDGGVFRYATRRDWSVPHYERMLYDNAGLLATAGALARHRPDGIAPQLARGIARFLHAVLRTADGVFVAAQDSESTIDGRRVEGAWYREDAAGRARLDPPPLDDHVLTGWNGLAIRALAIAGAALADPTMIEDARSAADHLLATHVRDGAVVIRSSTPRGPSAAGPALEDIGLFAEGLAELALASGEARYAMAARSIVDDAVTLDDAGRARVVVGADPVLAAAGTDAGEQPQTALRSGSMGLAGAAARLAELTGDSRYRSIAAQLVAGRANDGLRQPLGHADALALALELARPSREVVAVVERSDDPMARRALTERRPGTLVAVVTPEQARAFAAAGFELFVDRDALAPAAYVCHDMVCALPARTIDALAASLSA